MTMPALPASLQQQLRSFERRLCLAETIQAVCASVAGLLSAHWLLFVLDRFWETPAPVRYLLLLGSLAGFGVGGWWWARRWIWRRRDLPALAVLVQRRHPALGDRLQGVVELVEQEDPDLSPALREAAIRQVARSCEQHDFMAAVNLARTSRYAAICAILVVLAAGLALTLPTAAGTTWARLLVPGSATARFTFVDLATMPAEQVVLHGAPLRLPVSVSPDTHWQPARAVAEVNGRFLAEAPFEDRTAELNLPGFTRPEALRIVAGDAEATVQIQPVHRPVLQRLVARIQHPPYLQLPPTREVIEAPSLSVVEGSRVQLTGELGRQVQTAHLQHADRIQQLAIEGNHLVSGWLDITSRLDVSLHWTDRYGFTPKQPRQLEILAAEDAPPTIRAPGLATSLAILVDENLPMTFEASDDFGVKALAVSWVTQKPDMESPEPGQTLSLATGNDKTLTGTFEVSPLALGIPAGSMLSIVASASDAKPGRAPVQTQPYEILVLSHGEHARLIREHFERLQGNLEEVIRGEDALLQGKQDLEAKDDQELLGEHGDRQLGEQIMDEKAEAEHLRQIARQGQALLKEAMRNKTFDSQLMYQWAELMQNLDSIADQSMPRMQESLQQARQAPDQRRARLSEAIQQQERILADLRQQRQATDNALESMVIDTIVTRLRQAARMENAITAALSIRVSETIGLNFDDLSEGLQQMLQGQAKRQLEVKQTTAELATDLRGFNSRTRFRDYQAIHEQMVAAGVPGKLSDPADLMLVNRTGQALSLTAEWAKRFTDWADLLEGLSGQDSDGSGDSQDMQAQAEAMLTLLRLLQEEATIRAKTRQLEQQKDQPAYLERARALSDRQLAAFSELGNLETMISSMQLGPLFEQVGMAMLDAGTFLRQPRTDSEPVAAETEAIEVLAALIQKGSSQVAQQNPQMAALLQQLLNAMQGPAGASSGSGAGNPAGGDSMTPNEAVSGAASAIEQAERPTQRASGAWRDQAPLEFREALEGYYQGLERLQEAGKVMP